MRGVKAIAHIAPICQDSSLQRAFSRFHVSLGRIVCLETQAVFEKRPSSWLANHPALQYQVPPYLGLFGLAFIA